MRLDDERLGGPSSRQVGVKPVFPIRGGFIVSNMYTEPSLCTGRTQPITRLLPGSDLSLDPDHWDQDPSILVLDPATITEMEFLRLESFDPCYSHSQFYWRILKKIILFSGF